MKLFEISHKENPCGTLNIASNSVIKETTSLPYLALGASRDWSTPEAYSSDCFVSCGNFHGHMTLQSVFTCQMLLTSRRVKDVNSNLIGMTAGIITSCLWTFSSLWYASAGKRIGSFSVSAYRIAMAVGFLVVSNPIFLGVPFPIATSEQWFWMGLSGIVGLGLGDFGLFSAFLVIGPKLSLLVMSSSAIFATIGAYLMLGETVRLLGLVGIAVTLAGIIIAILAEGKSRDDIVPKKSRILGLFLALVGAFGQGIGVVLAKKGMLSDPNMILNPLSATLMRTLIGALFIWIVVLAFRKPLKLRQALSDKEGIKQTALAAFTDPFLGVTLSMVAVANTQTGIAQTLMSLMPVLIIPAVWALHGQKTCLRGIVGAIMTVVGVAVLFLI